LSAKLLHALTLVLFGVAFFVFVYTLARAPSRPGQRLGRRGMKRTAALATAGSWAQCEPMVRWLGVRLSGIIPASLRESLDLQILHAGDYVGLTAEEYFSLFFLGGIAGAAVGAGVDVSGGFHGLATIGGLTLGTLAPYLQISAEVQNRKHQVTRSLPYAVDLLSLAMSAGLDFPGAVRQVVGKLPPEDPLCEEFSYMLQQLQLGNTRADALRDLARRVPAEAVKEFVQTIVHAEEKGNPVAESLIIQAQVSRQRRTTLAEEAASKAGVQMVIPMGLMFLTIGILILGALLLRAETGLAKTSSRSVMTSSRTV
jgi:tight adherence protein C